MIWRDDSNCWTESWEPCWPSRVRRTQQHTQEVWAFKMVDAGISTDMSALFFFYVITYLVTLTTLVPFRQESLLSTTEHVFGVDLSTRKDNYIWSSFPNDKDLVDCLIPPPVLFSWFGPAFIKSLKEEDLNSASASWWGLRCQLARDFTPWYLINTIYFPARPWLPDAWCEI